MTECPPCHLYLAALLRVGLKHFIISVTIIIIIIIIIKRRSGINPIPPMVKDRDYKKKQKQRKKIDYELLTNY